ncbi:MAG: hypothetical protein KIT75_03435 [Planctomycetota bacterium]|nr:hypothetical protein [Planctomycetota bacterium]
MAISYPTRASIRLHGFTLTPLQALLLVCLRTMQRQSRGQQLHNAEAIRRNWRRWLASNLTYDEWRRKGFSRDHCRVWCNKTMQALRAAGLLIGFDLTDTGNALAESVRPLFSPAMQGDAFTAYVESTYSKVSGRFAM